MADLNIKFQSFACKIWKSMWNGKIARKRLPIIEWLPKYKISILIQDVIAGLTVGLTAIPQGIAYAAIAGLPTEYGLYASLLPGIIYAFLGTCKDITIGPTAILSALTAKYVADYSADVAVLAAFLSGALILTMGVLRLGFVVEFISMPVISGFSNAAALQIAASQLKSLFGVSGPSGNYFLDYMSIFIKNIKTARLWDTILGLSTIIVLLLLKKLGEGCSRTSSAVKQMRWFVSLARNTVVVATGMILAFVLHKTISDNIFILTGDIKGGLPNIKLPSLSTVVGNQTYTFLEIVHELGPRSLVIPFVAFLEMVAITKVFSAGSLVDTTQEMVTLGLCNILGSFLSSMPVTVVFTRSALNHISGVQTPAGGIVTASLVILALTCFTSLFAYIPKATLAGMIITAVVFMLDVTIIPTQWRNSKRELIVLVITMVTCLVFGLEYGIIAGISVEALMLLYNISRPLIDVNIVKRVNGDLIIIKLSNHVSYCAADHVRRTVLQESLHSDNCIVIIDGINVKSMDLTVASNLMSVAKDLHNNSRNVFFLNFNSDVKKLCIDIDPDSSNKFIFYLNF